MEIFKWTDTYTKSFYSPMHVVQIVIMAVCLVLAAFLFYKRKNIQNFMYIFLAISTNLITFITLVYSFATGIYHLEWYLPLHICNLFILISVISCIFKKKVRSFLNEYMFYCGLGGCFIGIIIPASTLYYYEAYSFIGMIVWLYHIIIGVMAIYLVSSGTLKIRFYNIWKAFALLVPLSALAMGANSLFNTNFIGLNRFKPIDGLSVIANATGKFYPFVLIGGAMAAAALLTTISITRHFKHASLLLKLQIALSKIKLEHRARFTYLTKRFNEHKASWKKLTNEFSIKSIKRALSRATGCIS